METNKEQVLGRGFYARSSVDVAKGLLGRELVRVLDGRTIQSVIMEVAAYEGHTRSSSKGMRLAPGTVSISIKYGHALLDIATEAYGLDSCVTLIGAEIDGKRVQGPGNLTKAFKIDKDLSGKKIYESLELYVIGGNKPDAAWKQRGTFLTPGNHKGTFYV